MAYPVRMLGFVPSGTFAGYVDSNVYNQSFQDGYFVHGLVFIPRHSFAYDSFTNNASSLVTQLFSTTRIDSSPSKPRSPRPWWSSSFVTGKTLFLDDTAQRVRLFIATTLTFCLSQVFAHLQFNKPPCMPSRCLPSPGRLQEPIISLSPAFTNELRDFLAQVSRRHYMLLLSDIPERFAWIASRILHQLLLAFAFSSLLRS
ncbi:hypothetical protein QCA50_014702 [Cerrena zonata]|uniref:Uncharacterized protein n=1 Tax=Cerrena zonata TaxID=2478898 RepID=A0AAW0FMY5_9APHY